MIAALAGSTSAFFAWRSASKTSKAADAANEALALTLRPAFSIGIGGMGPHREGSAALRLYNTCAFDAVNVDVWVRDREAKELAEQRFPRVRGTQPNVTAGEAETIFIPKFPNLSHEGDSYVFLVTVRYSDDRDLRSWEQVIRCTIFNEKDAATLRKKFDLGEPRSIKR